MRTAVLRKRKDLQQLYFLYDPFSNIAENTRREIIIPDFIIPDSVAHQYLPNFQANSILGRLSPIFLYTGGSPRTISFTIILNDDIAKLGGYNSIVDLVEAIKSLSYPKERNKIKDLPPVYFQLGELSGNGIIETSIAWKKPYEVTTGYYKLAEVSFNITIEQGMTLPRYRGVQEVVSQQDRDIEFEETLELSISEEEKARIISSMELHSYADVQVSNLVLPYDADSIRTEAIRSEAEENFDFQAKRLSLIYGDFATSSTYLQFTGSIEILKKFKDYNLETISSSLMQKLKGDIAKAKADFRRYLQEYKQQTDLTERAYFLILDQVFTMLEKLEEFAEVVYKYGAGD